MSDREVKGTLLCSVIFTFENTHSSTHMPDCSGNTGARVPAKVSAGWRPSYPKGTVVIAVFIEVKIKFLCVDVKPAFPSGLFILRIKNTKGSKGHAAT